MKGFLIRQNKNALRGKQMYKVSNYPKFPSWQSTYLTRYIFNAQRTCGKANQIIVGVAQEVLLLLRKGKIKGLFDWFIRENPSSVKLIVFSHFDPHFEFYKEWKSIFSLSFNVWLAFMKTRKIEKNQITIHLLLMLDMLEKSQPPLESLSNFLLSLELFLWQYLINLVHHSLPIPLSHPIFPLTRSLHICSISSISHLQTERTDLKDWWILALLSADLPPNKMISMIYVN